jgi:capsular polysaccharide biosynthesis protein
MVTSVTDSTLISSTSAGLSHRVETAGEISSATTEDRRATPESTPDLMGLLRALRSRWRLAVLGGLLCTSLTAVTVYFLLPPSSYSTSALVFVAASRPKEVFDTRESNVAYATYQETQVTLAKSRKVIEAVLKNENVAELAAVRRHRDPIDWLGSQIKVDFPRGSEILKISLTGPYPPHELELLVNAVTDAYMGEIVEQESRERIARLGRLKSLFDELQAELRKKRKEYKDLAESMGASSKQNAAFKQQVLIEQLGQARQELLRLKSDLRNSQARVKILQARQEEERDSGEASSPLSAREQSRRTPKSSR